MEHSPAEKTARSVVQTLSDAGFIAYFAGGFARDYLLGLPCSDIDIATDAPPAAVMRLFSKTVPVGLAFGSVVVVLDGHSFEVTTFRSETGYADGRHPDQVVFSSPQEDAKRRSLTINGLFFDPLTNQILDYVGGEADLKAGIIRAIGNPDERFSEDKLRMIRAVRFAVRFKFELEERTKEAILSHAHELLPAVAMERIWQEFEKVKPPEQFARFLAQLHELGLLQQIFPELAERALILGQLSQLPTDTPTILKLTSVMMSLPLEHLLEICERLKVSKRDARLVELQGLLQGLLDNPNTSSTEWAHFYALKEAPLLLDVEAHLLPSSRARKFAEQQAHRQQLLSAHIARIREGKPVVTAGDLREVGVQPGKRMGALLREAERLAIECDLHRPADVLSLLQRRGLIHAHE